MANCSCKCAEIDQDSAVTERIVWNDIISNVSPRSLSLPFPPTLLICFWLFPHLSSLFPASSAWLLASGHTWSTARFFFFSFLEDQDKIHSTPRCCLTVAQFVFKWIAEKTRWPFAQDIYQYSPPTATTTILPSRSIIPILSFALFLFLYFWLALWTKHGAQCHCKACLLPSQVLSVCSSAPLRVPQPFSSVQLLCSLQKGLHLALVFFKPPSPPPLPFPFSSPSSLTSEKDRKWMQMSDPPELIAHSLFLLFPLPRVLPFLLSSFFFFRQTPMAGAVATSHTEHIDILNLTVEAVYHNSSMLVCCVSLLLLCLNLYLSMMPQQAGR